MASADLNGPPPPGGRVIEGEGGGGVLAFPTPPSRSRSVTETVNGSHSFTIQGYSLAKGMGPGKYIASDTFSVGGYQWAIYFYPDGKNAEDQGEVSILMVKLNNICRGYKRFFRRAALENSDFLKSDSLAITCTVGVVVSSTQGPRLYSIPVPASNMGQQLGALFESGENTDVSFEVDGELFHAHQLILASRSPVFKAQLLGPLRESNGSDNVLHVEDIEAPVFKAMLHFIYTDSLPEMHELAGSSSGCRVDTMMAQHLLAASDRYGLDRLRLLCEDELCKELSVDTVATTLALAEQHHALQLKAMCLKYAAENLAAVIRAEGFEHLRESCPALMSELLQTVAGVDESRSKSVWTQLSDGADVNGRRVRQRT